MLIFLTRDELEVKYSDRWVVIQDGTYVDGSILGTMIDGVVVAVYTSEEYKTPECRWKYAKPGYSCERTYPRDSRVYISGLEYVYPFDIAIDNH